MPQSDRDRQARIITITNNLYETMPGAEAVPSDERGKLWGEVENTLHYEFCNAIANLIVLNSPVEMKMEMRRVADELGHRGLVDLADDLRLAAR